MCVYEQDLQQCFVKPNVVALGEVRRVPAFFYLLSLHHRTLLDVVRDQHPEQRPLPFPYVVAVVSGMADALEVAAENGVVHLDIKEDNVMVDDAESMDFDAAQRAAAPPGEASTLVVDFRACVRRFERPPVAVVIDWGVAMQFDGEWVLRVPCVDGELSLPEGSQPWGNGSHAGPELHMEWKRASDEVATARLAVAQAYRAKNAAEQRTCCCHRRRRRRCCCRCHSAFVVSYRLQRRGVLVSVRGCLSRGVIARSLCRRRRS
jgi:serine/threonine protein kinase